MAERMIVNGHIIQIQQIGIATYYFRTIESQINNLTVGGLWQHDRKFIPVKGFRHIRWIHVLQDYKSAKIRRICHISDIQPISIIGHAQQEKTQLQRFGIGRQV